MDEYCLVHTMVPNTLEEDSPTEQRDLESVDVHIGAVVMPGVCADRVGEKGREKPIKVEQEEESAWGTVSLIRAMQTTNTHRRQDTISSKRKNLGQSVYLTKFHRVQHTN
jgi:hypothetical protein